MHKINLRLNNYPNSDNHSYYIELAKTQVGIKKEPTKEALNLNGGADASRFELLMIKYMKNLLDTNTDRICDLIKKLGMIM